MWNFSHRQFHPFALVCKPHQISTSDQVLPPTFILKVIKDDHKMMIAGKGVKYSRAICISDSQYLWPSLWLPFTRIHAPHCQLTASTFEQSFQKLKMDVKSYSEALDAVATLPSLSNPCIMPEYMQTGDWLRGDISQRLDPCKENANSFLSCLVV